MESMLTTSSLQPWLDLATSIKFPNTNFSIPQLQPCISAEGTVVNCSDICEKKNLDDLAVILDPARIVNLINCGLWRTASNGVVIGGNFRHTWLQDHNADMLRSVGWGFPAAQFTNPSYNESDWAWCFGYLWSLVHPNQPTTFNVYDHLYAATVATPCEPGLLFGDDSWGAFFPACIAQVCDASGWLNPDVGGIGVSISFIVQTCLAIIVFVLLVAAEHWPKNKISGHKNRTWMTNFNDELITANAEFYKTQCYFAGAIQIACLTLAAKMDSNALVEYGFFFGLATSGSVPVIFNLLCITRYGRSSWYFVNLAICCFFLSTATLCFSQWYWQGQHSSCLEDIEINPGIAKWIQFDSELGYTEGNAGRFCGDIPLVKLLESWCGTSVPIAVGIQVPIILSSWNWLLWAICLIWLLYCIIAKSLEVSIDNPSSQTRDGRMHWVATKLKSGAFLPAPLANRHLGRIFFAISWPIAFGYQLYTYSLFFSTDQINPEWGFGQIVAVTIWASCLAEYILVFKEGVSLAHRFRLPRGYFIVKQRNASSLLPPSSVQQSAPDTYIKLTPRDSTDQLTRTSPDPPSLPAFDFDNVHEARSML